MTSRREFLRNGTLALGALAVGERGVRGSEVEAEGEGVSFVPLYTVVYDDRFAPSVAFAQQAQKLGLRASSLDAGDVTRLWYDDLYHRWKRGPASIGGLTTAETLFVLEGFGNDAGLRLRFRGQHRLGKNWVEHQLHGSGARVAAAKLRQGGADWSGKLAQLLSRYPDRPTSALEARGIAVEPLRQRPAVDRLYSWVLAPKSAQCPRIRAV